MGGLVDNDIFTATASFGDLGELVIRNEHSSRRAFGWMLKTHGNETVEVSAGKGDPAFRGSLHFDVAEDCQGRA